MVEVLSIYLCRFGYRDLLSIIITRYQYIILQISTHICSFAFLCIITLSIMNDDDGKKREKKSLNPNLPRYIDNTSTTLHEGERKKTKK